MKKDTKKNEKEKNERNIQGKIVNNPFLYYFVTFNVMTVVLRRLTCLV